MSKLNFPTKLICLTKATLTIVTYCVKIQNECSESFETRQGLRQGDVLSTLLFNVKTLILPVLLYGTETWVLTKRKENQLLVFERKVLRTICGPKIENGVYRKRYNHELDKEFDSPNALNVKKTTRLRHAGHMIRRPEVKDAEGVITRKVWVLVSQSTKTDTMETFCFGSKQ
jgi:hypothetical protein